MTRQERYCIVPGCNRKLRTGNKYCHIHRGFANLPKEPEIIEVAKKDNELKISSLIGIIGMVIVVIPMYFLHKLLSKFTIHAFEIVFGIGLLSLISVCVLICRYFDKEKRRIPP